MLMHSRADRPNRDGVSLLEIILGLPILLILLLAVVQFGLLQSNQQALHLASRQAGLVAAELALPSGGSVPNEVVEVVNVVLREHGVLSPTEDVRAFGGVRIDHSVDATDDDSIPFVLKSGEHAASPPPTIYPPTPYVQVTVSLEATRLTPNTLTFFGINFAGRYASQTSLFPHEP